MKRMNLLSVILFTGVLTFGQVIHIPDDYTYIQEGINSASNGDTVLVSPGTYFENLDFTGKNITVASLYLTTQDTSYISQTIIEGDSIDRVITFENSEDSSTVLCGFTITNGFSNSPGGGICCINSSPVLENLVITENEAYGWGGPEPHFNKGGGIFLENSNSLLENVDIRNNQVFGAGGGIYCLNSSPTFRGVKVQYNAGSGIYLENTAAIIDRVTIRGNDSHGLYCRNSDPYLRLVSIHHNGDRGLYLKNSFPEFDSTDRCSIYMNRGIEGIDVYSDSSVSIVLDTFSVVQPNAFHAHPLSNFSFDILQGATDQVNANLYVSPSGDNSNSGLSASEPLKNIYFALVKMIPAEQGLNTIFLDNGLYSKATNDELFPALLPDRVALKGAHADSVVLNAASESELFRIEGNDLNRMEHLTIKGGKNSFGSYQHTAGGIHCENSKLILESVKLFNNRGGKGGAIYLEDAYLIVDSCTIQDNISSLNSFPGCLGAGICCLNSDLIITHSGIIDNVVHNTTTSSAQNDANGGGIYALSSKLFLDGVTLQGNTTRSSMWAGMGGGIYAEDSEAVLMNSIINNNDSGRGGGAYLLNSEMYMNNSAIDQNVSFYTGGGIYSDQGDLELVSASIRQNTSKEAGGGIYCINSSSVIFDTVERCNIHSNAAPFGRDLWTDSNQHIVVDTFSVMNPTKVFACPHNLFTYDILHGQIEQVSADLYVSPDGDDNNSGLNPSSPLKTINHAMCRVLPDASQINTINLSEGVYSPSANGEQFPLYLPDYINLTGSTREKTILDAEGTHRVMIIDHNMINSISNLTITGGELGGVSHGAGILCINADPTLTNLTIADNYAILSGGGIWFEDASPTLVNVKILDNYNSGISVHNSSVMMEDVLIEGNQGSGIRNYGYDASCTLDMTDVIIQNNSGGSWGGGIRSEGSLSIIAENSVVRGNSGGSWGGGISVRSGHLDVKGLNISGNRASSGGGIYAFYSTASIENVIIMGNQSSTYGGGISGSESEMEIINTVITANHTTWDQGRGGGISLNEGSQADLVNVTLSNNRSISGGSIYCSDNGLAELTNCISWGNYPDEISGPSEVAYSNLPGLWTGSGNMSADPLFEELSNTPCQLMAGSPCIDAGTPEVGPLNLPEKDILGNERIWDGDGDGVATVDMGAYEFGALPVGLYSFSPPASGFRLEATPNPVSNHLNINFQFPDSNIEFEHVHLTLVDMEGSSVMTTETNLDGPFRIDLSNYPAGLYLVKARAGKYIATQKIIKR